MNALVVAIDGPSGSGKSSLARGIAEHRGLAYLDTGAMYRAATIWVLQQGVNLANLPAVADAVRDMPLEVSLDPRLPRFWLDGRYVTEEIRDPEISAVVSQVATNLEARPVLIEWQRRIIATERTPEGFAEGRGIVVEGRDLTTVVAPEADVRILLIAGEEERLRRRTLEIYGKVDPAAIAATRDQVLRRDRDDSTVVNFSSAAEGVITIDNTGLALEETIQIVLGLLPPE